jgi:hypothetical protein
VAAAAHHSEREGDRPAFDQRQRLGEVWRELIHVESKQQINGDCS